MTSRSRRQTRRLRLTWHADPVMHNAVVAVAKDFRRVNRTMRELTHGYRNLAAAFDGTAAAFNGMAAALEGKLYPAEVTE